MKITFLFNLILAVNILSAQNLVFNPGFEQVVPNSKFGTCSYTKFAEQFNWAVRGWKTYMGLTPDLIILENGDDDCFYPKPRTGNQMAGIITYHPGLDTGYSFDFHEYIQGKLKAPLQVGETYQIEFYINQGDSTVIHHLNSVYSGTPEIIPCSANNLGFYFSTIPLSFKIDIWKKIEYNVIQPQFKVHEIIKTKEDEWLKITGSFVADYPFRYFVIGNFNKDMDTRTTIENEAEIDKFNSATKKFWAKKKRVAYYCIDDVSISPAKEKVETALSSQLKTANIYTFQNVNFTSGSADLLPSSIPELDGLSDFLSDNPEIKIQIEGHTDSIGSEIANQELSEKRANAVVDYLVAKGFSTDRISFWGYGEKQPIETNASAVGREKNRRVNVKIKE